MSLHLRRPDAAALARLADLSRSASLTYEPIGISALDTAPRGYHRGHWTCPLGTGDAAFDAAGDALREWSVHRGAGLIVFAEGPPAVGAIVAMAAPLPVGYIDVVCRVVEVVDRADRFGFVYGTLPIHPEQGEETFVVVRNGDDVSFEITAISRPRHPLARVAPPIANLLQRRATMRYLDAMRAALLH